MDYHKLNNTEKLDLISKVGLAGCERSSAEIYIKALRDNDLKTIRDYECMGEDARHILMNKRSYDQGLKYGFTSKMLNEHGWLERPEWLGYEEIEFFHKKGFAAHNYIGIGHGPNGKWTYGVSCSFGMSGCSYGISVWGTMCDNRDECLTTALKELLCRHGEAERCKDNNSSGNYNDTLSKTIRKQAKEMYDYLIGRTGRQLSLF